MYIIGGIYRSHKLKSPKREKTRPTASILREALFNICQDSVKKASFLDLFAGSGIMGLEALSRGASHAVFVDNSKECITCIKHNLKLLGLEKQADVLYGNVFTILQKLKKQKRQFDIIYADPPYNTSLHVNGIQMTYSNDTLKLIDESSLLAPNSDLFIEEAQETPPYPHPLNTLQLKSRRKRGRSVLFHYIVGSGNRPTK